MPSNSYKWTGRPKCLGSSEDSLLQQLSSRISVVSNSSSSSRNGGGYTNNFYKHKKYNGNAKVTGTSQKEMNILLNNHTLLEMGGDPKKPSATVMVNSLSPLNGEVRKIEMMEEEIILPGKRPLQCLWKQVFASVAVSIGSMVVGFASAYTSPALASMREEGSLNVTLQQESWIGSLMPLSALAGGIAGGPLIELIGRKTTILATAMPFIISWLLIGLAQNIPMVYAGRVIAGFCVGIASLCLPVYMGETVQAEVRGMLGLISTTFGNLGILLCFLVGKYLDWSNLAFFGAMIPVPFLICMCFIPETPRWYISKNKPKEARNALQWLRGKNADVSEELAEVEKNHMEAEKNSPNSIRELLSRKNINPIMISIGLMFFQQFSGINAVIFYTVQIFEQAGSTIDGNLSTIIVGVVNLCSTFLATALIDRLGRKILLYVSAVSMILSLITLGIFFHLRQMKDPYVDVSNYGWVPLLSFVIFVIGFSLGYGPVPWLMMGEILPARIRGAAASLATAFNWACTFIVTKTFADLVGTLGSDGAFWLFAVVCSISLFFVFFCVPETQGKSLEDIEKKFKGPVRRMSSLANIKPMPMAV